MSHKAGAACEAVVEADPTGVYAAGDARLATEPHHGV